MATITADLADVVSRQHGIITLGQLLGGGLSPAEIRGQVAAGLLLRVHNGVYRYRTHGESLEGRSVAACVANPALVITGPTGGELWGLRKMPRLATVAALIPTPDWPHLRGVTVRRVPSIAEEHIVRRDDGIRLASPPRLWFDLAVWLDDRSFESVTEQLLDRHCAITTIWRTLRMLGGQGRKGTARAQRVLSSRSSWQRPADSDLELRVLPRPRTPRAGARAAAGGDPSQRGDDPSRWRRPHLPVGSRSRSRHLARRATRIAGGQAA